MEKKEQISVSWYSLRHDLSLWPLSQGSVPLARTDRQHLTVISVSISASWQALFTVSLFHSASAFFWFLVSAAVLPSNTRAAQILWLVCSVHTVLGYLTSIIRTCGTVAEHPGWSFSLTERTVKTLCYVKRGEWEFAHCSGKLMSPPSSAYTLCETRVKIFFDLVIVGITIGKWVHMNYWRVK